MEESLKNELSLSRQITEGLGMERQLKDPKQYSSLQLAFVGDCIFDLVMRTYVLNSTDAKPETLHRAKSKLVKASAQADMIRLLQEELTEEEMAVYKRGRNAHTGSMAKNASAGEYRMATGLEALCGYLYLAGREDRMLQLIRRAMELQDAEN